MWNDKDGEDRATLGDEDAFPKSLDEKNGLRLNINGMDESEAVKEIRVLHAGQEAGEMDPR